MTIKFKIFRAALAVIMVYFSCGAISAQNMAITTIGTPPASSAIVDLSSTSLGLLIPRMTYAEMLAIATPATSLMVYSTTDNCFYFYTGSGWQAIHCTCLGAPLMNVTGDATPCQGSSQMYTATLVSGSPATSYVWTFPAGTVITAGQGTATVTVTWGATSGTASLTASNTCGTGGGVLGVTVTPLLPSPTPITGPTALNPCASGINFTVPLVPGALSYTWSILPLSAGTVCNSGQGTNAINVTFGSAVVTYTISVTDSNACGRSNPATTINVVMSVAHGTITETVPGHYVWVVPCGITQVTVTLYGAAGGKGRKTTGLSGAGGKGAKVVATYPTLGGNTFNLYVGQAGQNAASVTAGGAGGTGGNAGDEDGGNGYGDANTATWGAGGGGGAPSDIRLNNTAISARIFVAGAGGGGGREDNAAEAGGTGGTTGTNGAGTPAGEQGLKGIATSGGAAVLYSPGACTPVGISSGAGNFGTGGNGGMTTAGTANTTCHYAGGGGGGGGYYGGSGGCSGGGGGGSSYVDPTATGVTITAGNHAGNGGISIQY